MAQPEFSRAFLDRYEVLKRLGEGGVATVHLARQRQLDRICAVKTFSPSYFEEPGAVERFLDEGKLLALVRHPNVLQVFDSGMDGAMPFLVLEYVEGRDLRERILEARKATPGRALAPTEAFGICAGVAAGLDAAHAPGVVHRDLKPENILLTGDGTPKVADFGFAKMRNFRRSYRTREGMILGTPYYVAPEVVAQEETGPGVDIYALGIILYECLTGKPPFAADNDLAILVKHTSEPMPLASRLVPDLPPQVDDLIQWCTRKKPRDRPKDAATLRKALTGGVDRLGEWSQELARVRSKESTAPGLPGGSSVAASQLAPARAPARRSLAALAGVAVVVLVAVGMAGTLLAPDHPEDLAVHPTFDGFAVRWRSRRTYQGRVAYRRDREETWQELLEESRTATHSVRARDLEAGDYQVSVRYPDGEAPCPSVAVKGFKVSPPKLEAGAEGPALVLRTSIPIQVSLGQGGDPAEGDWSPLQDSHRLPLRLDPDAVWDRPVLHFRDAAGSVLIQPLDVPLHGSRALARILLRSVRASKVEVSRWSHLMSERAEKSLADSRTELRDLADRIKADEGRDLSGAIRVARFRYMEKHPEVFQEVIADLPFLPHCLAFQSMASRWFADPGIPEAEKLDLYDALVALLPLDATAEAFGADPPLGIERILDPLVILGRVGPEAAPGRFEELQAEALAGRGKVLMRFTTLQDQTIKIPNESLFAFGAADMVGRFWGLDMEKVVSERSVEVEIPPSAGESRRQLHLWGFNFTEWLLAELAWEPVGPGKRLYSVARNSAHSFPGIVMDARRAIDHDQILTLSYAAWLLPPGRYRLRLTGQQIPGQQKTLTFGVCGLALTW